MAAHGDRAFVRAGKACEDADKRRLACAVRAEQPEELALFDREADALERLERLVALLDVTNFDGWHDVSAVRLIAVRPKSASMLRGSPEFGGQPGSSPPPSAPPEIRRQSPKNV